MNKSMLTGVVAGIAVATAGGVAGYAFLGQGETLEQGSAIVMEEPASDAAAAPEPVHTVAVPAAAQQPVARPAPRPQPAVAPAPAPAPVEEECWDEEVTVQAEPRDDNAIAGTAIGAVLGGALAKEIGDDNDLATAAGAAAGAFAGRRMQRRYQENNTTTTIERRCAPVGTR
ncbi:MAG TPA: glycine zipper 2TM domain-containing protein [Gammaproteobacteria bacterium]